MDIIKKINVAIKPEAAFKQFVSGLNAWWPKQYTWSADKLVEIRIDPHVDGLCTEIGPFGFRCDWGRVTEMIENGKLSFTWQISPARVPEPNPDKASQVTVLFTELLPDATDITLIHSDFAKHGDAWAQYAEAMDSPEGWPTILEAFKIYCEHI